MYEAFFGLTESPFRLTPDPRFLYLSGKHAEALAHLRLGLTEPGGFVCITGDIGTGKTTVLRTFLADLGTEVATAYVFNPTLSWPDLLVRIGRELGVPAEAGNNVDMMDALNAHLLAHRKDGRISVVVIDEAQALPMEVLERLRLLSNLETSTEKLLRLVLVGQPQLAGLLRDPALEQLNQRITLRWHLGPLTRNETKAYVRHRLAVAGGDRATNLFTGAALWQLHRFSKGVPRLVNMIAHRAALAAFVKKERRVTLRAVRRAYREIRTVPLTGHAPRWRWGWAVSALAVAVGVVTIGVPRLGPLPQWPWPRDIVVAPAPEVTVPDEPVAAAAAPAPAPTSAPAPAITPANVELERELAGIAPQRSLEAAVERVLAVWEVEKLDPDERPVVASLEPIAHRRNLEDLRLTGNLSMLRLLDLPAVLELRLPATNEARYAALVGIDNDRVTLAVADRTVDVTPAELDRIWFGDAHVLWRDFEWLGPTFGNDASGAHVARLQELLKRAGLYSGQGSGAFDEATEIAVVGFQRSRRLDPDCRVGRLTRIALYGAVGGYKSPRLAASGTGQAAAPDAARGES